jgi:hypothetical protein
MPDEKTVIEPTELPAIPRSSYLHFDDRTTWPDPADPAEIGYRLRYGEPSKSDLIVAASFVAAYRDLILSDSRTARERATRMRQLRETSEARRA